MRLSLYKFRIQITFFGLNPQQYALEAVFLTLIKLFPGSGFELSDDDVEHKKHFGCTLEVQRVDVFEKFKLTLWWIKCVYSL